MEYDGLLDHPITKAFYQRKLAQIWVYGELIHRSYRNKNWFPSRLRPFLCNIQLYGDLITTPLACSRVVQIIQSRA